MDMPPYPADIETLRNRFHQHGQSHVFSHWNDLSPGQQEKLAEEASGIDLGELDRLVKGMVTSPDDAPSPDDELSPPEYIPLPRHGGSAEEWRVARQRGEEALRAGKVAAFTVAGGQGTRLGFEGPKGSFPVTPVLGKPLFQVFAEKILVASRRYGKIIPWFIMTSPMNHKATTDFFGQNHFFGLAENQVSFFPQGSMPAVDSKGHILMTAKDEIALSPDGHGGSLRALVRSGAMAEMEALGIDLISYFQVDNPMVRCIDPAFIGFHLLHDSEMTSKMVPKRSPDEKVGVFATLSGKLGVLEYSDLSPELATATDADGQLLYRAGSIAIHLFSRDFAARAGGAETGTALPFHLAHKKVPHIGEDGMLVNPSEPNAHKFEMFVFDALPAAKNPILVETLREEEFSPVKNADGLDSPETCRADQLRLFAQWILRAGGEIPCGPSGVPDFPVEVSPLFGDDSDSFEESWQALPTLPRLEAGAVLGPQSFTDP